MRVELYEDGAGQLSIYIDGGDYDGSLFAGLESSSNHFLVDAVAVSIGDFWDEPEVLVDTAALDELTLVAVLRSAASVHDSELLIYPYRCGNAAHRYLRLPEQEDYR